MAKEALDVSRAAPEHKDKFTGLKLVGELLGYIDKGGVNIQNNNLTVNRVMRIRDHGTDEQWEETVRMKQAKLTGHAATAN